MRVLETDRLALRKITRADAPFILEMLNDPAFLQFVGDRKVRTIEDAERYIERGPTATYETLGFGYYIVELKHDAIPVGMCGLRTREGLDDVDLGYAFLAAHRGRWYGEEAAGGLLKFAREVIGLPRVSAICSPGNVASIRVLQKIGFRYQNDIRLPGETEDVSYFTA